MPLEDLTGNKYISNLNESWPAGTDYPDAGDDHIRGVKNVLKKTFPNITGPITRTQDQLNTGDIPSGSVMLFYQAAAPTGWTRTAGFTTTYGLRIVPSTTLGGAFGGTDDPVLNSKVPTHTHDYSSVSGNASVSHTHGFSGTTSQMSANATHGHPGAYAADHVHSQIGGSPSGNYVANGTGQAPATAAGTSTGGASALGVTIPATNTDHSHTFSGTTGSESAAHAHAVSGVTGANAGAANWTPRYIDMIVCTKS